MSVSNRALMSKLKYYRAKTKLVVQQNELVQLEKRNKELERTMIQVQTRRYFLECRSKELELEKQVRSLMPVTSPNMRVKIRAICESVNMSAVIDEYNLHDDGGFV